MTYAMEQMKNSYEPFQQVSKIWKHLLDGGKVRHEEWLSDEFVYLNEEGEMVDEQGVGMEIVIVNPAEWYEWKLMGKVDIKDSLQLMNVLSSGVTVIEEFDNGCYNKYKLNSAFSLVTAHKEGQWHDAETFPNPKIYTVYYLKQGEENE